MSKTCLHGPSGQVLEAWEYCSTSALEMSQGRIKTRIHVDRGACDDTSGGIVVDKLSRPSTASATLAPSSHTRGFKGKGQQLIKAKVAGHSRTQQLRKLHRCAMPAAARAQVATAPPQLAHCQSANRARAAPEPAGYGAATEVTAPRQLHQKNQERI